MKQLLATCFFLVTLTVSGFGQSKLSYYLPQDIHYDSAVPTPKQFLGFEVGEWHVRPDQIVRYFELLAESSPRCQLQVYGRTHEARPLVALTVSAPGNIGRLDAIQTMRRALVEPSLEKPNTAHMPVVLWMGYSVHGDEPSGANAALLYAYYLAAAKGQEVDDLLNNSIVLLDPCLNPDGLGRFAHWANTHRGKNAISDPNHREHRQPWPSGRTNHYWFDLNRDWLLAQHPESQGRLKLFHQWRPNVVTDFHEMGTNSSYFFQPGVLSRHNPLIPQKNYDLTAEIADFHGKALDRLGSLYYTRESYDDFYFGKGSTYPDGQGSVGILFEQGSSRGHAQMSRFGLVTFPFTIRNQLTTSISSHQAAVAKRVELLDYQREFCESALDAAVADPIKAWVFASGKSDRRARKLVHLLQRHQIEVHSLAKDTQVGPTTFTAGNSFLVRGSQSQYRLLKSLFEFRTTFNDPVFYDVSAWNMFAAYDLDYGELDAAAFESGLVAPLSLKADPGGIQNVASDKTQPFSWMFDWDSFESARLLNRLLDRDVRILVCGTPVTVQLSGTLPDRSFDRGSVVIPRGMQDLPLEKVVSIIEEEARLAKVQVFAIQSGMTTKGADLGSPSMGSMRPGNALILVGGEVSTYEAGEVWHLLDARLGMRASLVETKRFAAVDLNAYTHVLAVSGAEKALAEKGDALKSWLKKGGILIAQRGAAQWAGPNLLGLKAAKSSQSKKGRKAKESKKIAYAGRNRTAAFKRLSGAIFRSTLDVTHPLGWGISHGEISVWRKGTTALLPSRGEHNNPMRYLKKPLVAGFASLAAQEKLANTVAANVERLGAGVVVLFADDMNFRGYWRGTERLYLNAIFHARFVAGSGRPLQERDTKYQDH